MKKILTKIVTVFTIAALALSTFVGCGLITTDTDKDLAQIVASVKISDDVAAEDVLKKEMRSAYMSYGYYYVSSYGYTESQAYALILDNLVGNRVVIQKARVELGKLYNDLLSGNKKADTDFKSNFLNDALAGKTAIDFKNGDVDTLKKYLTEYEVAEVLYDVRSNINSLIDSYDTDDDEDDDEVEDETFTARASAYVEPETLTDEYELKDVTPTEYEYKVADVTINAGWETLQSKYDNKRDLNKAVYDAYKIDLSGTRKKALAKAIKALKKNGLLSQDESINITTADPDAVLGYSYFEELLKSQYESAIVAKYEASLHDDVAAMLDDKALWEQYVIDYNQQKFNYSNDRSAYETALDEADEDTFVICNPYDGERYGYVANLLIGFTDEQTSLLSDYSSKAGVTKDDIAEYREGLLKNLVAKDQRETWAQSSYGTFDSGKFTFESKHFASENSVAKLGSFIGTIIGASSKTAENDDKVEETTWSFDNIVATAIPFDTFVTDYLSGLGIEGLIYDGTSAKVGTVDLSKFDDIKAQFDDLIYAFSTDPGSLGKYYGYTYSPETSADTYVEEFANAAKAVVAAGKGAYTIVATDYGYHVMLCTKVIDGSSADEYVPGDAVKGESKFIADIEVDGTFANEYYTTKFDSICDNEVSKIANQLIKDYKKKVTKYRDAYSDLIDAADEETDD